MIEQKDLESLMPHKGRMLLLTRVLGYSLEERTLTGEYHITDNCLFYDPEMGGVPAWAGFEFLAQAIAALSGIYSKKKGEAPKIGFILSISSVQMHVPFYPSGCIIELKVKEINSLDQVSNFEGEIFLEGKKVMEGNLMVIDANEEQINSLEKERKKIG